MNRQQRRAFDVQHRKLAADLVRGARATGNELFDRWSEWVVADQGRIDALCNDPADALEALLDAVDTHADELAAKDPDMAGLDTYRGEAKAAITERFHGIFDNPASPLSRRLVELEAEAR